MIMKWLIEIYLTVVNIHECQWSVSSQCRVKRHSYNRYLDQAIETKLDQTPKHRNLYVSGFRGHIFQFVWVHRSDLDLHIKAALVPKSQHALGQCILARAIHDDSHAVIRPHDHGLVHAAHTLRFIPWHSCKQSCSLDSGNKYKDHFNIKTADQATAK